MIGRLQAVVIDCPEPSVLATFYGELLGARPVPSPDGWAHLECDNGTVLAFQLVPDHRPPRWPDPAYPQQAHLDVLVDDLDVAQARVLELGAQLLEGSDKPIGYRVYADPAGHPFCLSTN